MAACPRGRAELDTLAAAVDVLAGGLEGGARCGEENVICTGFGGDGGGSSRGCLGWSGCPVYSSSMGMGLVGGIAGRGEDTCSWSVSPDTPQGASEMEHRLSAKTRIIEL